jgi:DNA-binding NarL/FixJ family response regulator
MHHLPAKIPTIPAGAGAAPQRVLLVDDQPATRRFAALRLQAHAGIVLVGSAASSAAAAALAAELHPDVVVVGLLLAEGNGIALGRQLCAVSPGLQVVITGHEADERIDAAARRAGAAGFVPLPALSAERVLDLVAREAEHRRLVQLAA